MTDEETKDIAEDSNEEVIDASKLTDSDVEKSSSPASVDDLSKIVKELREAVAEADRKASNGRRSEDLEKIDRVQADMLDVQKSLNTVLNKRTDRRGEFEVSEDTNVPSYSPNQIKALLTHRARPGTDLEEIQRGNDEMYLAQTLMGGKSLRSCDQIMDYARQNYPALYKSMETGGAGIGAEWIPTNFSSSLFEDVRLELKVAAQHERFNMPTDPYKFPVEGADAVAYSVPQNTDADADLTASNRVTKSTPGTINRPFATSKVGVRVVVSTEMTEDSVIATLPYVRNKIVLALANAQENTVINGDERTSGATNLSGVTQTTGQVIAYDGYRRAIQLAGTTSDAAGALTLAEVRAARNDMKKFGVDISQLFWLCGINSYNNLLNFSEVTTLDKFGPNATIFAGQLGKLDGIPILVSEHVSEDLDAIGEASGGGTTEILLVRKDQFRFGDSRAITLKSKERIETDQQVLVALQRLDFKSMLVPTTTTNQVAAAVVNIAIV